MGETDTGTTDSESEESVGNQALIEAVKRATGAEHARVTPERRDWRMGWAKLIHKIGLHTPGESYEWDTQTHSLRWLGMRCVVCRKA
jgi:hypothetical protein